MELTCTGTNTDSYLSSPGMLFHTHLRGNFRLVLCRTKYEMMNLVTEVYPEIFEMGPNAPTPPKNGGIWKKIGALEI